MSGTDQVVDVQLEFVGSLVVLSFVCRGENGVGGLAFVDD